MMGAVPTLPPQFAKLAALYRSSTYEPERDTARRKAEAVLPPEAGGFERALRIQAYHEARSAAPGNILAGWSEYEEIDKPGSMARAAEARVEQHRAWEARRAALIKRYGSLAAVLEPDARELALRKALKPWRVPGKRPHQRWTWELKGWDYCNPLTQMATDMRAAIEGALSMPTTFAEAQSELAMWRARNSEMEDALSTDDMGGGCGDYGLDRVCIARMEVIRDVVEHEMRLTTMSDILARFRIFRERENLDEADIEAAVFRDLEAFATREALA